MTKLKTAGFDKPIVLLLALAFMIGLSGALFFGIPFLAALVVAAVVTALTFVLIEAALELGDGNAKNLPVPDAKSDGNAKNLPVPDIISADAEDTPGGGGIMQRDMDDGAYGRPSQGHVPKDALAEMSTHQPLSFDKMVATVTRWSQGIVEWTIDITKRWRQSIAHKLAAMTARPSPRATALA